jgi:uncharacterized RDD family membrane protein YckC
LETRLNYVGVGYRFVAQLIDGILLAIIYYLVGLTIFGTTTWSVYGPEAATLMALNGLIGFLYFVLLEGTVGTTLGKMALKMKVVREDGSPCRLGPSVIRNILRIVDILPFLYIVGMVLIARSGKKQRLGDRVAHTVVVRQTLGETYAPPTPSPPARYCINCGAEISGEARFCPKCGAEQ